MTTSAPTRNLRAGRTRTWARLVAVLTSAALLGAVPPASAQVEQATLSRHVASSPQPDELQALLDEMVANGASGAIALVDNGPRTRVLASGAARLDPDVGLRPAARVRVGSLTKTVVATVALQLVGEGRMGLDDTVEQWRPGLLPNGDQVTLRMLLAHKSGLFDYVADPTFYAGVLADPARVWEPEELVAAALTHSETFPPGQGRSYSNTGYIVAGLMLEAATGRSLQTMIKRRVIRPLNLDATWLPTQPEIRGYHARGYLPSSLTGGPPLDVTEISPSIAWAAGALVSDVVDVRRFYRALLRGRLLGPALLAEMQTLTPIGPGAGYGLGLLRLELPCGTVWGHSGNFPGYVTVALEDATGTRAAVVAMPTQPDQVLGALFDQATAVAVCRMFGLTPPPGPARSLPDAGRWAVRPGS